MDLSDLPNFTASNYTTTVTRGDTGNNFNMWTGDSTDPYAVPEQFYRRFNAHKAVGAIASIGNCAQPKEDPMSATNKLRVVRIFLVDPDERIPVDKRILHKTEEMITDATDQELFHGIPVADLLKDHNMLRATIEWEDGEGKSKTGIKDARIRDLVMSVTTIAQFDGRPAPAK
jgi:hypothetical protein